MAIYDEYFTDNDKPFAENINDALLLSNVFDMTVSIELPTMFSNGNFIENYTPRKCGVAIITLLENNGLTINENNITGTGSLKFKVYPNFNSFGNIKQLKWESEGDITCNIENTSGGLITAVSNEEILNNANLKTLKEYVVSLNFTNATLSLFTIVFENKESGSRYGADVKINKVSGLEDELNSIEARISEYLEYMRNLDDYVARLIVYENGSFSLNGKSRVYHRNSNKILIDGDLGELSFRTYSTNLSYPPIVSFFMPALAYWTTESSGATVEHYSVIGVRAFTSSGKLGLSFVRFDNDTVTPNNFNVLIHLEYLYNDYED